MKLNKIFAAVAAVLVFCMTAFAETTGDFTSFYVDSTGKTEIIGYFEDYPLEVKQCGSTMLMTDGMTITSQNASDHIMYLDQQNLGNNGVFYYRFQIDEKFSESPYELKVQGGTLLTQTGTLREIPSKIYNIADNAIRIGNDVYDIGCPKYTPDNISNSIAEGGNVIYYKIGGRWYNMLNENATSTAYFVPANAVPESEWDMWEIDNYYHY